MAPEDKSSVQHADYIEPVNQTTNSPLETSDDSSGRDGDDIVTALQHTGEEVGMTWRSFMAAAVSQPLLY